MADMIERPASCGDPAARFPELVRAALAARERAYAPYSHFYVGAALLASDGTIHTGCNVENASYSATCCAERTALFKAVSEGRRDFLAAAVAGGAERVTKCPPCGVCRQALAELCPPELPVLLVTDDCGHFTETSLGALLPEAFGLEAPEENGAAEK